MPFLDDDLITVVGRHAFFLAKERTECATMLWRCNIEASVMRIDMTYDISSSLDRMTKCMASGKSLFASFNKIVDKDRARDRAYDTFLIPAYTFGLEEEIQGTKIHTQNIYGEISESHDAIIPHGILDIVPILRVGQTVVCSDKLWATMQSGLNFEYFTAWDAETGEPL